MSNTTADEAAGSCTPTAKPGCDADPRKSTPLHRGTAGAKNVPRLFLEVPQRRRVRRRSTPTTNDIDLFRKGRTGFWQINTASHTDCPQQSRQIEVMDNPTARSRCSATLLDHAAPTAAPATGTAAASLTDAQLASICRVLAWNDPQREEGGGDAGGRALDRNAELVLADPRECSRVGRGGMLARHPARGHRRGRRRRRSSCPTTAPRRPGRSAGAPSAASSSATATVARRSGAGLGAVHADHRRAIRTSWSGRPGSPTPARRSSSRSAATGRPSASGPRSSPPTARAARAHTISDASHSATRPELAVAADGTAVAAWAWHDRDGLARAGGGPAPGAAALRPSPERLAADQQPEPLAVDRRRRRRRRPRPR